ncbi:MAG: DUF4406 domain-containing protein [Candidatus Pacebacteria bacterium]|jgi:hypothetical protein|nr:DUF4406 domain-containing protein [Candidatus Paceibacterota bacterium]
MQLQPATKQYWTVEEYSALASIASVSEMYQLGQNILNRMPDPVVQVCGPISTGGAGSIEGNLLAFAEVIRELQEKGMHVFDQLLFEIPMQRFKADLLPGEYLEAILTDFYQPLFESGKIRTFYFMQNWQSSYGARWEHDQALRLGIEIVYL